MKLLQSIADALAELEDARRSRQTKAINDAYMRLRGLPCADMLNTDQSHTGSRLWFDVGVLSTRFFWKDGLLQPLNDKWTSSMGPFYFSRVDHRANTRYVNAGGLEQTWAEAASEAQELIAPLLS